MINLYNTELSHQFCFSTLRSSNLNSTKDERDNRVTNIKSKIVNLILGIAAVIIFIPFLVLICLLSKIVPQKQWEDFWEEMGRM